MILFVPTLDASFGCSEVSEAETTCYRKRTNFPISFTAPLSGFDLVWLLPHAPLPPLLVMLSLQLQPSRISTKKTNFLVGPLQFKHSGAPFLRYINWVLCNFSLLPCGTGSIIKHQTLCALRGGLLRNFLGLLQFCFCSWRFMVGCLVVQLFECSAQAAGACLESPGLLRWWIWQGCLWIEGFLLQMVDCYQIWSLGSWMSLWMGLILPGHVGGSPCFFGFLALLP